MDIHWTYTVALAEPRHLQNKKGSPEKWRRNLLFLFYSSPIFYFFSNPNSSFVLLSRPPEELLIHSALKSSGIGSFFDDQLMVNEMSMLLWKLFWAEIEYLTVHLFFNVQSFAENPNKAKGKSRNPKNMEKLPVVGMIGYALVILYLYSFLNS